MKFLCQALTFSFLGSILYANDFAGTYEGHQSTWLSWGEPCRVQITSTSFGESNFYKVELLRGSKEIYSRLVDDQQIIAIIGQMVSQNISFSNGTRWSEGAARQDTKLYFTKGQLTKVYFAEAYLILPATKYTCGKLKKQKENELDP